MNRQEFRALVDEVAAFRADHGGALTRADRDAIKLAADEYAAHLAELASRTPEGQRGRRARRAVS